MSKLYFFMNDSRPVPSNPSVLPDVYCPVGGYYDKNLGRRFDSKREKARFLKSKGFREAEVFNPEKSIGGTEGRAVKQRGSRGNFQARPVPSWVIKELATHV